MTPEDLIARGFYVIPCHAKDDPAIQWKRGSSNDPVDVRNWRHRWPKCIWAVDCEKSGLFVVDDDRGKNAESEKSLMALELEYGALPPTFTVRTPSGGLHYYYRGLGNSTASDIAEGIDTRSLTGYVVACEEGRDIILDLPIAPVPEWFVALAGAVKPKKERTTTPLVDPDCESALVFARHYLQTAPPSIYLSKGDKNALDIALRLKDFGVSEASIPQLLSESWNDRCQPPWSMEELEIKASNAYNYGTNPPGFSNPTAYFSIFVDPDDNSPSTDAKSTSQSNLAPNPSRYKFLTSADVDKFPPLQWRVKGLLPSRGVSQVYGPSKSGKSFLTFDMLVAIAEGRTWFGHRTKPCPVVYICLEGEHGMQQRKQAWEKENMRRLPDNFFMVAQSMRINAPQDVLDLGKGAPKGSVLAIDTQNRAAPGANENASEDIGAILQGAKTLSNIIEGMVVLVAHTGKDLSKGVRGHSSQIPFMDAAMEVRRDGELRWWRSDKVKDGVDGEIGKFRLRTVHLRDDEDGDPVTSCVIDLNVADLADGSGGIDLKEWETDAWVVAKMAASQSATGEFSRKSWKEKFDEQCPKKASGTRKNQFAGAVKTLTDAGLVKCDKGMYYISALTEADTEE